MVRLTISKRHTPNEQEAKSATIEATPRYSVAYQHYLRTIEALAPSCPRRILGVIAGRQAVGYPGERQKVTTKRLHVLVVPCTQQTEKPEPTV